MCGRLHRYTTSKQSDGAEKGTSGQSREEEAASVHRYTGSLLHYAPQTGRLK